jgi:hypothetical protein
MSGNALEPPEPRGSALPEGARDAKVLPRRPGLHLNHLPHYGRAMPNPSLKRSANGTPPGPGCGYAVHCPHPGPGAVPSSPS